MQIHVVDVFFRLLEGRFVAVFQENLSGRPRYSVPDKFSWNKKGHETAFYKAKRRIDDMNLHKKTRRIQLE